MAKPQPVGRCGCRVQLSLSLEPSGQERVYRPSQAFEFDVAYFHLSMFCFNQGPVVRKLGFAFGQTVGKSMEFGIPFARVSAGVMTETDFVYMDKSRVPHRLKPEIPIFQHVQIFVEAALQVEQRPMKQDRVDRDDIGFPRFFHLGRFMENAFAWVLFRRKKIHPRAGIGAADGALAVEGIDQRSDVVWLKDVIVVENNDVLAIGAIEPDIGGPAAWQWDIRGNEPKREAAAPRR